MNKEFFIRNREKLADSMSDNSILILFAGIAPYKSADEQYQFIPNRNFYYITGIDNKKIIFLMSKINGKLSERLFIERPDPVMAKWIGATISEEEATEKSGIENIDYLDKFEDTIG